MAEIKSESIEFLAEQDGVAEQELKAELTKCLEATPSIARAYLAVVRYHGTSNCDVALCLAAESICDEQFLARLSRIFSNMFGCHEHLDIMVLTSLQEETLLKVCQPFFTRSSE